MKDSEKKKLLLITDNYPFGLGDSFLFTEIEFLLEYFSITVISTNTHSEISSEYTHNFSIYRINKDLRTLEALKYAVQCFLKKEFYNEIKQLSKKSRHLGSVLFHIITTFSKSLKFADEIRKLDIIIKQDIIYCYWHNYKVLGVGFLVSDLQKSKIPIVSRIHGYDLYNERTKCKQQLFKHAMDKYLSMLFFVSEYGYTYYKREFGFIPTCEYKVSRLGVHGGDRLTKMSEQYDLSLISVSSAIPLKRIELIVLSLELVTDYSIRWVHFGDGNSLSVIKELSDRKLKSKANITYIFMGHTSNHGIYDFYKAEGIDVFITTSSTEGIPVSIQEAFSYGVPVIGTRVGGIPEMIDEGVNGLLISENPCPQEVKGAIDRMFQLKSTDYFYQMKQNAFLTWSERFDAERNYRIFAENLYELALAR